MHLPQINSFISTPGFLRLGFGHSHISVKKILLLSSIALTTLALTIWQVVKQNHKVAVAICIGGSCIEIALGILFSSKTKKNQNVTFQKPISIENPNIFPKKQLSTPNKTINFADDTDLHYLDLEANYPVKQINPMDPKRIERQQTFGMQGMACGNAIGLYTEFTTEAQAKQMINGKSLGFDTNYPTTFINGYNWNHIKRFVKNGWTDATDQALCLLRALYRERFPNDQEKSLGLDRLFAQELIKWRKGGLAAEDGFKGRSNPYCIGSGGLVCTVLNKSTFLENPFKTSIKTWASDYDTPLKNRPGDNGALMRTTPIAFAYYQSFTDVIERTFEACVVTHADPRCAVSCVAVNIAITLILRGYDIKTVLETSEKLGILCLNRYLKRIAKHKLLSKAEIADIDHLCKVYQQDFSTHFHGNWSSLDLDEGYDDPTKINKIDDTFKCMGAAFHSLRLAHEFQNERHVPFESIMAEITAQGGAAGANGAVAGALVGAFLGAQHKGRDELHYEWPSQIADVDVLNQAVQHIIEISEEHSKQLKSTQAPIG